MAVVALMTHIDFTLSNARRFYSSMGNPSAVKGLNANRLILYEVSFTLRIANPSASCSEYGLRGWRKKKNPTTASTSDIDFMRVTASMKPRESRSESRYRSYFTLSSIIHPKNNNNNNNNNNKNNKTKIWSSHLLDNLSNCLMNLKN